MRTLAEQIANRCKHFNGCQNKACSAGVKYEDARDPNRRGLPCFKSGSLAGGKPCEKATFPTPEEVSAEVEESNRSFENTMKARSAIVAHLGAPWKRGMASVGGKIDCPCCGSKLGLHFSRAGYNGHIHARCETKGCVSWME